MHETQYVMSFLSDLILKDLWNDTSGKGEIYKHRESNTFPPWISLCLRISEVWIWEAWEGTWLVPFARELQREESWSQRLLVLKKGLRGSNSSLMILLLCTFSLYSLSRLSFLLSWDLIDDFNEFPTIILGCWFWSAN